jgi:hypothetical protein
MSVHSESMSAELGAASSGEIGKLTKLQEKNRRAQRKCESELACCVLACCVLGHSMAYVQKWTRMHLSAQRIDCMHKK